MSYVNGNGVNLALDQIENLYRNTAYGSLDERLRAAFRTLPTGDLKNAISRNIRGINHRQIAQALMPNLDHYGLTFFTRPDLNLATPNIRQSRMLTDLLTENQKSIPRAVRCLLDPSLQLRPRGAIECPLVDANLPFIPILTNSLISCSGWPDWIFLYGLLLRVINVSNTRKYKVGCCLMVLLIFLVPLITSMVI